MWNRFVTISITRDWREDSSLQPSNRHLQHCRVLNNALAFFDAGREKKRTSKHRAPDSLPLDGFDVSLLPGEQDALLATRSDTSEANRWSLCEVAAGQGYEAALCVRGHDWRLRC